MSLMDTGYKFDVVKDADGLPTGITAIVAASVFDGAIGALTSVFSDKTHYTGMAKLACEVVKVGAPILITSKIVSNNWIPKRAAALTFS